MTTTEIKTFIDAPAMMNPFDLIFNDNAFNRLEKVAALMASGRSTIPKHLQGNPGDCFAIVMQSARWHIDPYACAQKTYLVNGIIGYEAQLIAAVINKNAPITGRLRYEWFGPWEKILGKFKELESKTKKDENGYPKKYTVPDWKQIDEVGLGVKVWATIKGEDEPRVLSLLLTQARVRNSTMWAEDPKQQLAYLANKKWSRLHCPDVIMGVYSPDEMEDMDQAPEKIINPVQDDKTSDILNKINKKQPPIDMEPLVTLDEVMTAIKSATGNESLKEAKALMFKLVGDDRTIADNSYRSKVVELKKQYDEAQKKATEPEPEPEQENGQVDVEWELAIRECGDDMTLEALLDTMPEALQTKHQKVIEEQFMLLG